MYRRRLARQQVAMVPFRPVNGPLEPLPAPALKPREAAREIAWAAPASRETAQAASRAPLPVLKPAYEAVIVPAGYAAPPLPELKPRDLLAALDAVEGGPLPKLKPPPQS
jgi:hypothetical protein